MPDIADSNLREILIGQNRVGPKLEPSGIPILITYLFKQFENWENDHLNLRFFNYENWNFDQVLFLITFQPNVAL